VNTLNATLQNNATAHKTPHDRRSVPGSTCYHGEWKRFFKDGMHTTEMKLVKTKTLDLGGYAALLPAGKTFADIVSEG